MKRIGVVTATRAEYGILKPILDELKISNKIELSLYVTGTHLSEQFGMTVQEIEEDGFEICERIEVINGDVSPESILTRTIKSFTPLFKKAALDLVIILGDRFEILGVAESCLLSRTKVAHLHGGEITEGAFDDSIRHAITKMSHIHFCSNERHRKRIIQMGENPDLVFSFGAPGLDNIRNMQFIGFEEIKSSLGIDLGRDFAMITYHPVTLEGDSGLEGLNELFLALDEIDLDLIFTLPNIDPGHEEIIERTKSFVEKKSNRFLFNSLGTHRYLSLLSLCRMVIGNSSSGIIEAPFLGKPVVNIGDRQKGRASSDHVIHCVEKKEHLLKAFDKCLDSQFLNCIKVPSKVYGNGRTAELIVRKLEELDLSDMIRKSFFDIE